MCAGVDVGMVRCARLEPDVWVGNDLSEVWDEDFFGFSIYRSVLIVLRSVRISMSALGRKVSHHFNL